MEEAWRKENSLHYEYFKVSSQYDFVNFIISKNYLGICLVSYKYFFGDGNLPRHSNPGKVYSVCYLSLSNNTRQLCRIYSTEVGMT